MNRFAWLFLLVGCHTAPATTAPGTAEAGEERFDARHRTTCRDACAKLAQLHCPEGAPRDDCFTLCESTQGTGYQLPAVCVADAGSVPDIRACGVRCMQ